MTKIPHSNYVRGAPQRFIREAQRNELTDLDDDDGFPIILRLAAKRLPTFTDDTLFPTLVRRIWRSHGDMLPDDLEMKYRALRDEVAWMENEIDIAGDLPTSGLCELARLMVDFHSRHRHLAGVILGRSET